MLSVLASVLLLILLTGVVLLLVDMLPVAGNAKALLRMVVIALAVVLALRLMLSVSVVW